MLHGVKMEVYQKTPYSSSDVLELEKQYNLDRFTLLAQLDSISMKYIDKASDFVDTLDEGFLDASDYSNRVKSSGEKQTIFLYYQHDNDDDSAMVTSEIKELITASKELPIISIMGLKLTRCPSGNVKPKDEIKLRLKCIEDRLNNLENGVDTIGFKGKIHFKIFRSLGVSDAYIIIRSNNLRYLAEHLNMMHCLLCHCDNYLDSCGSVCILQSYTMHGFWDGLRIYDDNKWNEWGIDNPGCLDSLVNLHLRIQVLPGACYLDNIHRIKRYFDPGETLGYTIAGKYDISIL
jgi:hypothetical protein